MDLLKTKDEIVIIPTKMKVGNDWYKIVLKEKTPNGCYGRVGYALHTITIATHTNSGTPIKDKDISDTLWHEMTHAILYDMGSPLHDNEEFVAEFSSRLNKAILSAQF
jgi:hypothetical protein